MIGRFSFYTLCLFFALMASGLYLVKYEVQELKNHNDALQQKLNDEKMALHVLQAEWVYLNQPDRLMSLAEKYLKLEPIEPRQVVGWAEIPVRAQAYADASGGP